MLILFSQSFNLPSVKDKPELAECVGLREGSFGVPEVMLNGITTVKSRLETAHPLVQSERNVSK